MEFHTATHLMARGFDVEFTDLEGHQRYDLLVLRGDIQIEIDCKAPSGDVGRKIHGHRFREFASGLMPHLEAFAARDAGSLILVTIPGRLHGQDIRLEKELMREIAASLKGAEQPHEFVEIRTFNAGDSPFDRPNLDMGRVAEFLESRFGLVNAYAACNWRPRRGAAVLVMQSADPEPRRRWYL